ncbi:hypothetical protein EW146_g6512 [Bondarzewia mesenterica]|uniref:Uncharacterized protein n=1 Tax=Bondarzewia mesenterica TaxID=1095465 RepID=A0A4S4LP06_9AGAM|nr:hypothetical protein EW146_g6512 [Bondarzewia mesenterica]
MRSKSLPSAFVARTGDSDERDRHASPEPENHPPEETSPLLRSESATVPPIPYQCAFQNATSLVKMTSLPITQLACLCAVHFVEPMVMNQVLPSVNEMLAGLQPPSDADSDSPGAGPYSGMIGSVFSTFQLFAVYQLVRLSGMSVSAPASMYSYPPCPILVFADSHRIRLPMKEVIDRALSIPASLSSANGAVVASMLGEITDSSNQAIAFSVFGFSQPLGDTVGTWVSTTFSNPAVTHPRLCDTVFFRAFPYFIPGVITAAIAFVCTTLAYHFMKETLPPGGHEPTTPETPSLDSPRADLFGHLAISKTNGILALLSAPAVRAICISAWTLSFTSTAFDVVFDFLCSTPIESGGLALSLLVLPLLLGRYDHLRVYTACMTLWPICFALLPLLNVIAWLGLPSVPSEDGGRFTLEHIDPRARTMVWCGILMLTALVRIACMAFSVNMILVKENAPSPASLGTTNGLVQSATTFAQAVGTAFVSALVALSFEHGVVLRYLWVVVLVGVSFVGMSLSKRVQKSREMSAGIKDEDEDDVD